MGTDDESFERFALPRSGLADIICERADFCDRVQRDVLGLDESPFVRKGIYGLWREGIEFLCAGVDAMEV